MNIAKGRVWQKRWRLLLYLALVVGSGFPACAQNPAPASPILLVTNSADRFSGYCSEILLTEGLNEFTIQEISTLSNAALAGFDVVILGEVALTAAQVAMFSDWVNAGGKLIAMRPDKQLAGLLGLVDAGSTLAEGYLLVNTASGPGVGIVGQTIQFHGTADRYTLGGASVVATLYSDAQTATTNPAVTLRSVGVNGGQAGAFTFDLARSVVYTRQGNPAWSGQARDGQSPIRSDDLFYGAASINPQPDWVDLNKVEIPQADEQQRLLANMIIVMDSSKNPLPRFWYFPRGYQAVVVMTGDDHANNGTAGRFDQYISLTPTNASVADWQAIRSASYILTNQYLTDSQAAAYNAQGFEIGVHLNTGCSNWTRSSLASFFTQQLSQFRASYPSLPVQTTHRIHCVPWSDYTTAAEVSLQFGIRMDVNYYYYPATWIRNRPGLFTGSGMPMRFARMDGSIIDVYQAPTQMTDESGQSYPYNIDSLLDAALGQEGYYGAFVTNMHTDFTTSADSDAIVASATSRGVPIIAPRQLLTWLDARNASTIKYVNQSSNRETFSIQADANATGLQAMVPVPAGYTVSSVQYNGSPLAYSFRWIKGMQYAVFSALTGDYEVSFAINTTPPTITAVAPSNGASGVSSGMSISIGFSDAMAASSINTNTITLRNSSGTFLPASVYYSPSTRTGVLIPRTPLALGSTYTATVKGGAGAVTDVGGISLAADSSWSFATATQYPSNIWPSTAVPGQADCGPDSPVELGVKFRSAIAGKLTGIRFYKSSANTGTHVGNLWSSTGTLLASATFSSETASGWQQMQFSSPVAITSNTVYVASYHCNSGRYSADASYFYGLGVDSYPLHALADGESGGNGVYVYGLTSAFPNKTYQSDNYWVDVVFEVEPAASLPVVTVSPATTNVECGSAVVLTANAAGAGTLSYQWFDNQTNLVSGETGQTLTLNNVHSANAGNYTVVVTDPDGAATNFAVVDVVDTTTPAINWSFANLSLSADANCQALMPDVTGTNYVLAADVCSSALTITQTPTNNTVLSLGANEVVLAVADGNGNTAYSTNWVIVKDTTAPAITLLGANPLTNECHSAFADPGGTVTDNCSGVVSLSTNSTVNPDAVGVYAIEYMASDAAGNLATNARTVYVVDTVAPVIVQCAPPQAATAGYNGLTTLSNLSTLIVATDPCGGSVNITQEPPTGTEIPVGTNTVVFYVDDGNGNTNTCSSTVTVHAAPLAPPTMLSEQVLGDGSLKLTFSGPDTQPYMVRASADFTIPLGSWDVLTKGAFGTVPVTFIDSSATSQPMRFYRVVSP